MRTSRTGFTLLELMILIAIIGILVAIATPFYLIYAKEARKSACIANMKKIEGAVMLVKMTGVPEPVEADLFGPTAQIRVMPKCPKINAPYTQFDPVACPASDPAHVLPPL